MNFHAPAKKRSRFFNQTFSTFCSTIHWFPFCFLIEFPCPAIHHTMVSISRFDLNFCAPHSTIHWSLFYVSIGISPPNAPPHNDRCLALHLNFASLPHNGVHYVLQIQWSRLFFNSTSLLEKIHRCSAFLLVVGKNPQSFTLTALLDNQSLFNVIHLYQQCWKKNQALFTVC